MSEFYTGVERLGSNVLYRGYRNGNRVKQKIKFKPSLYVPSKDGDWKTLVGDEPLEKIEFGSMSEAGEFVKMYRDVPNFKIHGITRYPYQYLQEKFPEAPEPVLDDMTILSFDIEVYSGDGFPEPDEAKHPILSISAQTNKSDLIIVWGLVDFDEDFKYISADEYPNVEYRQFQSEYDLLKDFYIYWASHDCNPDIVTGWNTNLFDIPYIINRGRQLFGDEFIKMLSPWSKITQKTVKANFREQQYYNIFGVQQLDYLDLFKKFAYTYGAQESYKLDDIARVVLNKTKLDYSGYKNLQDLYDRNPQKFLEYNIVDTRLVNELDEELNLMGIVMQMASMAGVNPEDTLGTTTFWDTIIFRELAKSKIAPPPQKENHREKYPGAYVKEPKPGLYDWIMSFDLASLYPNIIVQYNISPDTLIEGQVSSDASIDAILNDGYKNPIPDTTMTPNGIHYVSPHKKVGILPKLVIKYYSERKAVKGQMLDVKSQMEKTSDPIEKIRLTSLSKQLENKQMALKISLNSLYGAQGSNFFRYYDIRCARGITEAGQLTIMTSEKAANRFLNTSMKSNEDYVCYIDTDSVYVDFGKLIDYVKPESPVDFLDNFGREVMVPVFSKAYNDLAARVSDGYNRMDMDREVIGKGLWVAKKRYIINTYDNEGIRYKEPKLKIMGIEAIKSSTPEVCREEMKSLFKVIMNGTESDVQGKIAKFREVFGSLDVEKIAAPRGTTDIMKYKDPNKIYGKGAQSHIRSALLYNHYLKFHGLTSDYDLINNGDRLRFVHLRTPNPIDDNVIGFNTKLPPEFGLHDYVDREKQFQKVFLEPFVLILDSIGWKAKEVSSLDSFFN